MATWLTKNKIERNTRFKSPRRMRKEQQRMNLFYILSWFLFFFLCLDRTSLLTSFSFYRFCAHYTLNWFWQRGWVGENIVHHWIVSFIPNEFKLPVVFGHTVDMTSKPYEWVKFLLFFCVSFLSIMMVLSPYMSQNLA